MICDTAVTFTRQNWIPRSTMGVKFDAVFVLRVLILSERVAFNLISKFSTFLLEYFLKSSRNNKYVLAGR